MKLKPSPIRTCKASYPALVHSRVSTDQKKDGLPVVVHLVLPLTLSWTKGTVLNTGQNTR
ncbi:hypothetical protein L873DRAFT_1812731 [Choiromyces venosus 120613-1]|uniref:Uncharacterized protein n=1 Tax=Choiromyces venosus 120613-1 TaxID=1336337 RepID=A0A3N4JGR8_9PEZI|nr:hypothetical protein L873DRAFT_1812731 [Choiromyces venosus 120613-1]